MNREAYVCFTIPRDLKVAIGARPDAIPPIKKSKKDRVITEDQKVFGGGLGAFAKRALLQHLSLPLVTSESREDWLGATECSSGDVSVINDGAGAIWVGDQDYDYGQALALANCLIHATNMPIASAITATTETITKDIRATTYTVPDGVTVTCGSNKEGTCAKIVATKSVVFQGDRATIRSIATNGHAPEVSP